MRALALRAGTSTSPQPFSVLLAACLGVADYGVRAHENIKTKTFQFPDRSYRHDLNSANSRNISIRLLSRR